MISNNTTYKLKASKSSRSVHHEFAESSGDPFDGDNVDGDATGDSNNRRVQSYNNTSRYRGGGGKQTRSGDNNRAARGSSERRGGSYRGGGGGGRGSSRRDRDRDYTDGGLYVSRKYQDTLNADTVCYVYPNAYNKYFEAADRKTEIKFNLPEDTRISKLMRRLSMERDQEISLTVSKKLLEVLLIPDNANYVRKAFSILSESMLEILHVSPGPIAKEQCAKALGRMGYIMGQENSFDKFQHWMFPKVMSSGEDINYLFMLALQETLVFERKKPVLMNYASLIMTDLFAILEITENVELFKPTLDNLMSIVELYAEDFYPHFRDTTDLLFGWHVDHTQPLSNIEFVSKNLQRISKHFKMNIEFSVTLILHFIDDIETYSNEFKLKENNSQTIELLTLSILALNTVLKCLGDTFNPNNTEYVSVKTVTDSITQIINTLTEALDCFVPDNLVIGANESISLLLSAMPNKTMTLNTAVLSIVDLELSLTQEFSDCAIISMLLMIAKVIKELSANLPIELIPKLVGPSSELIKLRNSPFLNIQDAIICIYQSLLNLKNIPLLQEAYRYILGDLELVYRLIVPNMTSLIQVNPFSEAACSENEAEFTVVFLLRCLCQLANATGSIIGMWALKPSILELLGVHLRPYDQTLATNTPGLHYSLLYLLYSHCKCYNYFISSSTLVTEKLQKPHTGNLEEVGRKSPNFANFGIILDILYKSFSIDTSVETKLLLLQWFGDIIVNAEPYLEVLYNRKEFSQLAEIQIECGYTTSQYISLAVAENIEKLLSKKRLSWNNAYLRSLVNLCVLHMTSTNETVRTVYSKLSTNVPWDVSILELSKISELKPQNNVNNRLESYNKTSVQHAQHLHVNGTLYGELYPLQFKSLMDYLLKGVKLPSTGFQDMFVSCWPIEVDENIENYRLVNDRYRDMALVSRPIINNWATWEAAQLCVNNKLRTPLGKPNETFTSFEAILKQLAKEVMKIKPDTVGPECPTTDKTRIRLLLQFMENLEMSIYNASEGCAMALLQVSKPVRTFFTTNASTCKEWLSRIRLVVIQLSLHAGESCIALRHGQALLQDLNAANKGSTVEFERAAMFVAIALLNLRDSEALHGLYVWCSRICEGKFSWIKHAAEHAGKKFEIASAGYKDVMIIMQERLTDEKENVADIHVRYFISDQIINCHKELNNWLDVISWKNDDLYTKISENENGMRYSLNTVDFDCAQHLFNLEIQNYAFNELTTWKGPEKCNSWSCYDVLSNAETQLYHIALNISLQKDAATEKKIEDVVRVISTEIQDSLLLLPSEFLQSFNLLNYIASGLKNIVNDVPASTVFLVSEDFEKDVDKIDSCVLSKILWWSEYFAKVQQQGSSVFCSNLRLNIINKARKERNYNLASSHLYRFLKNKDFLQTMDEGRNTLLAKIASSFMAKIPEIQHWNCDTAKSVQELIKLLYEDPDNRQLTFDLCAAASTSISKCAELYGGNDLREVSSRILLKLANWLQCNEHVSITELNSPLGKLLMVLPEIGMIDNSLNATIPLNEMVLGKLLRFSVQQCHGLAKSWNIFGTWCYRWGRKIVDSSTDISTVLSEDDRLSIQNYLPIDTTPEDVNSVCTILSQTRTGTDEEDIDSNDTNTSEMILAQLKTVPSLTTCHEVQLEALVNIWRSVQKRVYAYYELSAESYFKYLELASNVSNMSITTESDSVTITLRLLRLIVKHALELQTVLENGLATTPTHPWKVIIPQLFSRLTHPECYVRQRVSELLCRIAKDAPQLITFPAVVGALEGGVKFDFSEISLVKDSLSQNEVAAVADEIEEDFDSEADEDKSLLQDCFKSMVDTLSKQAPETITQVQQLVKELRRIILLWDELWLGTLAQHQSDISKRQVQLTQEVEKVNENVYLCPEEKISLIAEKHRIIFKPIIFILEQLNDITSAEPETPHERLFQEKYSATIQDLLAKLKNPAHPERPQESWQILRQLQSQFHQKAHKRSLLNLHEISPILAGIKNTVISMPGQFAKTTVTIAKVSTKLSILPTKTKPKKLMFYGSDGLKYTYLFKGLEDLHLDERIMQFLSMTNTMMAHSSKDNGHDLYSARHYSVIPLGPRSGLISWVDGTTPAFVVYKRWQQRQALKTASKNSTPTGTVFRPSELFYNKLNPLLVQHGVKNLDNRKEWPLAVLRQVLNELIAETPSDLLAREFWCHSVDTATWWQKVRKYSYSVAVMSVIGYIIGLGDRHLDNVLVDLSTGEVVHIDYNVCFEKGKTLCVPEKVPFRLTPNIRDALGVTGVEGIFRLACEHVLKTMKRGRETLLTLLEAFVYDPLVDWTVGNEGLVGTSFGEGRAINKQNRKDLEREVTLAMYSVRCTEMRFEWENNRTRLHEELPLLETKLSRVLTSHSDTLTLNSRLQDLHQQMALLKEAEANPQCAQALSTLPSRYSAHRSALDTQTSLQRELAALVGELEEQATGYRDAMGMLVDPPGMLQQLCAELGVDGGVGGLFGDVRVFLQNAGQTGLLAQCEEGALEVERLMREEVTVAMKCVTQLQEYNQMLSQCPRSYLDKHRVHFITKLAKFLLTTQDINYFDQICTEFRHFHDDPPSTNNPAQLKPIFKHSLHLYVIYNELNAQITAVLDELATLSANTKTPPDVVYSDAVTELSSYLTTGGNKAEKALQFVLAGDLILLNRNFLLLETAAAKSGDWLLKLTSRDGDWFLDDLAMNCAKAVEIAGYLPPQVVTGDVSTLLEGLNVANDMYRCLYELNYNFHTIIVPESVRRVQCEDISVLAVISELRAVILAVGRPLVELAAELEKQLTCVVMEMEQNSTYDYTHSQTQLAHLQLSYQTLLHQSSSANSAGAPLPPGQMLLVGFNGLFDKLGQESQRLRLALTQVSTENNWRNIDQVREAKCIAAPLHNERIGRLLDGIFFVKRLQTMDEFFTVCVSMSEMGGSAGSAEKSNVVCKDERLIQPVRKYIADYISRRFLGVTTENIAYIVCHLLQNLGVDLSDEINQRDIGAEHTVPLDELYSKTYSHLIHTTTPSPILTTASLSQASSLLANVRLAWERIQSPKKLDQTLAILTSSAARVRGQLNTHSWVYEEVLTQHPLFGEALGGTTGGRGLGGETAGGGTTIGGLLLVRNRFMTTLAGDVEELRVLREGVCGGWERVEGLVGSVEQRLKWAAGTTPDEINPLLTKFSAQLARHHHTLARHQATSTAILNAAGAILRHEVLRSHGTPEARILDQRFLTSLDQWRHACLAKPTPTMMTSDYNNLSTSQTSLVTDVEANLMQSFYTAELVDSSTKWHRIVAERVSDEIGLVGVQLKSQHEATFVYEDDCMRTLEGLKGVQRGAATVMGEFRVVLRGMMKIEECAVRTQQFFNEYRQYSDHFTPFLRHIQLDIQATDLVRNLEYIKMHTDRIYEQLLNLAPVNQTMSTGSDSNAETNKIAGLVKQESTSVMREQQRNSYAVGVWRRVRMKLEGRDPDPARRLSVQEQVDYIIREASSVDNLSVLYEGWTPWV